MTTSVEFFHANCRKKWNCYNCPVCFYIRNPELINNSCCMKCNRSNSSLWFCITCGHVGCSRNDQGHALAHYRETKHEYVMELEKFKVWDYELGNYVHKLRDTENRLDTFNVHNKINGKQNCSCHVCRHMEKPKLLKKSMCMKCSNDSPYLLWICLSCFHIGCSRHCNGHALEHYQITKHAYCMQIVDFSIWNYTEHRFLHDNIEKCVTSENTKEHIENRMDRLENEWKEFLRLSEANDKMLRIEQRLVTLNYEKAALEMKLEEHDARLKKLIIQFYQVAEPVKYIPPTTYDMNSNKTENNKISQIQISTKDLNIARSQISYDSHAVSENLQHSEFISLIVVTLFLYHFVTLILQIIPENMKNMM